MARVRHKVATCHGSLAHETMVVVLKRAKAPWTALLHQVGSSYGGAFEDMTSALPLLVLEVPESLPLEGVLVEAESEVGATPHNGAEEYDVVGSRMHAGRRRAEDALVPLQIPEQCCEDVA